MRPVHQSVLIPLLQALRTSNSGCHDGPAPRPALRGMRQPRRGVSVLPPAAAKLDAVRARPQPVGGWVDGWQQAAIQPPPHRLWTCEAPQLPIADYCKDELRRHR